MQPVLCDHRQSYTKNPTIRKRYLIHCLDDYLTMGPPLSQVCQHNVDTFTSLCKDLGVPLATEKLNGPTTSLYFLGIIVDTSRMEISLSTDKLSRMQEMLKAWLSRKRRFCHQHTRFFGLLRVSEFITSSPNHVNLSTDLLLSDIAIDNHVSPQVIRITLKQSKTDQYRQGTHVYLGRISHQVCPVKALT